MRQRAGLIILITGLILWIQPHFDFEQMMMTFNYIVANYWPVGLILFGLVLINPKKKKTRTHKIT